MKYYVSAYTNGTIHQRQRCGTPGSGRRRATSCEALRSRLELHQRADVGPARTRPLRRGYYPEFYVLLPRDTPCFGMVCGRCLRTATEETWNVDPIDVERKITKRTSAILVVHLYGNPCEVEALQSLASRHHLKLIFDAAHGLAAFTGTDPWEDLATLKSSRCHRRSCWWRGEGGLVTTNDATLAKTIRAMRNYGDLGAYDPTWLGMNARMSEFNAALALAGMHLVIAKSLAAIASRRYTRACLRRCRVCVSRRFSLGT